MTLLCRRDLCSFQVCCGLQLIYVWFSSCMNNSTRIGIIFFPFKITRTKPLRRNEKLICDCIRLLICSPTVLGHSVAKPVSQKSDGCASLTLEKVAAIIGEVTFISAPSWFASALARQATAGFFFFNLGNHSHVISAV